MTRTEAPTEAFSGEAWRLLCTWEGAPGWNMALDEALLLGFDPRPALRFYTWEPQALSLGYFQRWNLVKEIQAADCVVRRTTGGGAIHHAEELTFSIAADLDHPLYKGEVKSSYERVHGLLRDVFGELGLIAELRGATPLSSDNEQSHMCFHRSTPLDLQWSGAKGVGSAQRRSKGRVLHHGSIKLGSTPLEGPIATLRSTVPELSPQDLALRVQEHFKNRWGVLFEESTPSPTELEYAAGRAAFFGSDAHLRRR